MKTGSRPQYYRIRRMVQMVREGAETGSLPNSSDFMNEFEVSRRTVARDLDFLRDEERAPLAYDDARHGFRLTDETYTLPPVRISRKEAFSFGLARKLLAHYEGTPLHLDMRSVLDKIAESLEGDVTIEPDWLSEHVGVLPEDRVRIDPEVWAQLAGFVERREAIRATYQTFDGRVSEYELHPYHLIAYHGNWYLMAWNVEKKRVATFALSRFRRIEAMGQTFTRLAGWVQSHLFVENAIFLLLFVLIPSMLGIMKKQTSPASLRSRAEIVSDMNGIKSVVSGKITEKRRMLKNGETVVYHQLQQWVDGRNVTTHIPKERLPAFTEAVTGHAKLNDLVEELSTVDTKAVIEGAEVKKKRLK